MRAVLISTIALAFLGCKDPSEGVPKAQVDKEAAKQTTSATKTKSDAKTPKLTISPANSSVAWEGSKVTASHAGVFKAFKGSAVVDPKNIEASTIELVVDTTSMHTDDSAKLLKHLKSGDFLDVETFPTATFKSTSIAADGKGYTISGDLTLRGKTLPISFPATINVSDKSVQAKAEFAINRKDFGIVYPGMKDDLIRDNVVLRLALNLDREPADG
jgi:polyisoprenoid-binding protein YceI